MLREFPIAYFRRAGSFQQLLYVLSRRAWLCPTNSETCTLVVLDSKSAAEAHKGS